MAKRTTKNAASSANVPTVRLGSVAALLRLPPGVRDEEVKKGGKKLSLVSITDLPEAGFIEKVAGSISLSTERFASIKKYCLEPFDLLMSIQGTVGVVGVTPERFSGTWMANISLLVVRYKENKKENAIALSVFLKSEQGRNLIKKLQKGRTIKRINVKEFAASQVPELTDVIKKASRSVFDREIGTLQKIGDLRESLAGIRASYLKG